MVSCQHWLCCKESYTTITTSCCAQVLLTHCKHYQCGVKMYYSVWWRELENAPCWKASTRLYNIRYWMSFLKSQLILKTTWTLMSSLSKYIHSLLWTLFLPHCQGNTESLWHHLRGKYKVQVWRMAFIAENWYCCCSHRTGSFASSIILLVSIVDLLSSFHGWVWCFCFTTVYN